MALSWDRESLPQWDADKQRIVGGAPAGVFTVADSAPGAALPGDWWRVEDGGTVVGYGVAQTLVQVLKNCGDDLTRANVMKQAASLKDFRTEVLLPGIKINTSPTDFAPISSLQLQRFKGERWELFGDVINAEAGG